MSSSENEVKVTRDDGYKKQWAKGLFYRREGIKLVFKHEHTKKLIVALFILVTVVVLLQDDPTFETELSVGVSSPEHISPSIPIELENFDKSKPKNRVHKRKTFKVEKLFLISRSNKMEIPLGTQARAILLTGASNGPVKAKLLEDVELAGEIYIEEGSILWGTGSSTTERLVVVFTKFVTKDGEAKDIAANAYDASDEILGLKGSIIGRTSKKIAAGAGLGVAGALKTMQQAENLGGVAVVKPTLGNAMLNGASTAALGLAEQELEELKNKQTIIEVEKGTEIIVVFGKG